MKALTIIILFLTLTSAKPDNGARGYILCNIPQGHKHVSIYLNSVWDEAKECSEKYEIPMALILAQMCLESKYGQSNLAKQNNHLGIKFEGKYAHFETLTQCLDVYGRTLSRDKYICYECQTIPCWLFLLDSNCFHFGGNLYTRKIKQIIKTYNLDVIQD